MAACPIALLSRRWAISAVRATVVYYVSIALVVGAICSPPIHGVHRWIQIGDVSFNPTLLLSISAILVLARVHSDQVLSTGVVVLCIALSLLLLSKSYSLAIHTVLTGCLFYVMRSVKTAALVFSGCILVIGLCITRNSNRVGRIEDHLAREGQSYQARRIAENITHLRTFGPSHMAVSHLPAAGHDFVFLDLLRKRGILAGVLVLITHAVVICLLLERPIHGHGKDSVCALVGSIYYCLAVSAHVLINVGILPPAGIPLPFMGRGLSARLAYCVLILHALGNRWEDDDAPSTIEVPALLIKHASVGIMMFLALVIVVMSTE
jgi:cell division protein FtsW (lipid II flippase)